MFSVPTFFVPTPERIARNESLFREVNNRIEELADGYDLAAESSAEFVCECSRAGCIELIGCSFAEYARVRSHPRRFIVRPGHEDPRVETVLEDRGSYRIVEKTGAAGEVAEALDTD